MESDEEEVDTVQCNECGSDVYADAERCPYCGNYQTDLEITATSHPPWIVATAILLLAVFAFWLLSPLF